MIGLFLAIALILQGVPASSSVEGFVVQAGSNPSQVLVNARLELAGVAAGPRVARTDRNGRFSFGELPAGVYTLSVTKDGYLRKDPGIRVDLKPNQSVKDLVVRLDSAPSIEGMIRDPEGNPVFNVTVQALRLGFDSRGKRGHSLFASTRTDDRGIFRIYWLDPGEYFLSATAPPPGPLGNAIPNAFVATYFPGFVDIDDAKPIRLERGRDATGMDFGLIRQAPATLTGFLSSRTRGVLGNVNVNIAAPSDGAGTSRHQGKSSNLRFSLGEFTIRGVSPGTYIVSSTDGNESGATRVRVRFDRAGRNAGDSRLIVNLVIGPGVTVFGRFASATPTPMDLRNASIQLTEIDEALPQPQPAVIGPDGIFTIPAVQPGTYAVSVMGLPEDLYLKNAALSSVDALAKPFSIAYGSSESPHLAVEIGTDGGRMAGAVFDGNNAPLPGAQVILMPEAALRFRLDRYRTAITDQDGRFVLRGIAPGDYILSGWSSIEPNAYLDAEYMRPYDRLGTPVRIAPGENPAVDLRALEADR